MELDLLLRGGRVIDPARRLDADMDVGFGGHRIALVASADPSRSARVVRNIAGQWVLPGLIDSHAHFYRGVTALCADAETFLAHGVTCAVEAGTAGAANYEGLRDFVIRRSALHLYAYVNISALGLVDGGFSALLQRRTTPGTRPTIQRPVLEVASVAHAVEVIESDRDSVVGVKVLVRGSGARREESLELLARAVDAAKRSRTHVLCHVEGGVPLNEVLRRLRAGDILTHCFHGEEPNAIGEDGKVRPELWEARRRGVLFDMAPAADRHWSHRVAASAAAQGFYPDIISTDYAAPKVGESARPTLLHCVAMMAELGMPLTDALAAATVTPAKALRLSERHGSLREGSEGDAVVMRLERGSFDHLGMGEPGTTLGTRLVPTLVVRGGDIRAGSTVFTQPSGGRGG